MEANLYCEGTPKIPISQQVRIVQTISTGTRIGL